MSKSIFTDNFPIINSKNNDELQKVIQANPEYDPYYIRSCCDKEVKEMFDYFWKIYQPFADRHFLADCKKHFHQRTWEMYSGVVFMENGLNISSSGKGPDFVINKDKENKIFIEATACEKGKSEDMRFPKNFLQ
jgi:hypothetical protein